ncbi:MAG: transporter substrate-binding domain-containing protein [Rhodoferax sp.]
MVSARWRHALVVVWLAWASMLGAARAAEPVLVGAYPFLPFVRNGEGLTYELVDAMNRFQHDYAFQLVNTSANRRYRDMSQGAFQMMLFENIKWGWDAQTVEASKVFLQGDGEVFVARSAPGRDASYFNDLAARHILAVTGYHYGFANFEADPTILSRNYRITFSADCDISLRNLLAGRGDVAIVTKSYLSNYLLGHREAASQLLVSDRFDQTYAHTALVRKGTRPSAQEIDQLLERMRAAGVLKPLWARYGM